MNQKKLYSIGEVSKIKGVTKKALRFYESIGLLQPELVDAHNGYRYYTARQFILIDIIKAMRALQISPVTIKNVLQHQTMDDLMLFLDEQKENARQKIDTMKLMLENITDVQALIRHSMYALTQQEVYHRNIAERKIITVPWHASDGDEDAILAFTRLEEIITARQLINTHESGILYKAGTEEAFVPDGYFYGVACTQKSNLADIIHIPAGEYVCICFNGESAPSQMQKLASYCAAGEINPAVVIQIELLDNVFATEPGNNELQVLLKATTPP